MVSEKTKKTRVSVTMTQTYVKILDSLVEKGVYLDRGEAILAGVRLLFEHHEIDYFRWKEPDP